MSNMASYRNSCISLRPQFAGGWYANNLGKRYILREIVLFWLSKDDLAETGEIFTGLNLGWDVPKPFLTMVGKAAALSQLIRQEV
jgi:hypothetical protein